jgi:hypothetical protein
LLRTIECLNNSHTDDCEPEIIAINSDSTFLVAGDRNGVVHFIHIESKAVIFSQELLSASQQNRESFAFQHLKFSSAPR